MASARSKLKELAETVASETGKSWKKVTVADLIFHAAETKTIKDLLRLFDPYYNYPIEIKRASPSKFTSPFSEFTMREVVDHITVKDLAGTISASRDGKVRVRLSKDSTKKLLWHFLDGPIQALVSRMGPDARHLENKSYSSWKEFVSDVVKEGLEEELEEAVPRARADINYRAGKEISKAVQEGNVKLLDKLVKKNIKAIKDELVRCEYENLFKKPWNKKDYIC
ncbi:MAG: hypothetical protein D6819_06565 [Gammaproteobacteria bacterium]|nr:MAG: hypothetical protein D6819_06565 [Gammaproteobacteria bacterium]